VVIFGDDELAGGDREAAASAGGTLPPLRLVGSHRNTLDAKRRVAIPKTFREQIDAVTPEGPDGAAAYVLCRHLGGDPCLALFPPGRFEEALAKLGGLSAHSMGVGTKAVRAYLRKLQQSAARIVPDKQGRVTLSEEQCRLAGITKEVVFVAGGTADHLEVWAAERLDEDEGGGGDAFGALASEIFG
jgi:division/cell wall cluster transcriptional repressor MraZ